MKDIQIKDIYAGKPDAKDEISFEGLTEFIKTYVVTEHFNIDSLINGTNCFIVGFKGTGKTALLFYLADKIINDDPSAWSSFVFFKDDYADFKRKELQVISHRILSAISVEPTALLNNSDFEYVWRWLFFKRIVADNDECNRNLFLDNDEWTRFEKIMNRIIDPISKRKFHIPNKIKFAVPFKEPSSQAEVSPEIELDLGCPSEDIYQRFVDTIDEAEAAFSNVTKTDIPYYIFVDELEAYYGEDATFKRDLYLIRDLLFSIKRFNSIFRSHHMVKTKIICSVRSEILNAITRFIVTKELNKVTSGFSVPLNWNYTNSNSYAHPIIQILLKRIAVCSSYEKTLDNKLYTKWFPEQIHGIEAASYILNNSWCKPRDIVRLISVAQNGLHRNNNAFTQIVFNSCAKAYSNESLVEIKEELRALYDPSQIYTIISCFTGYRTSFSAKDLRERINQYYGGSLLDTQFTQVLNDLYRLGFLGNLLPVGKVYHWQHKGDGMLILTDEWRMCVHYALHGALSIGSRSDYGLSKNNDPQTGDVKRAIVTQVIASFALVKFDHYGMWINGQIHISEFKKFGYGYIPDLSKIVSVDGKFDVVLKDYNRKYDSWNLSLILEKEQ